MARWDDGTPLVATNPRTVAINVWPGDYYYWSGDFPTLIHNAVIYAVSGANWLSVAPDSGEVAPFSSSTLNANVSAQQLFGGDYLADILIHNNDPSHSVVTIPFRLHVAGVPDIAMNPDSLDFGEIFVGFHNALPLLVSNKGTDSLTISSVTTSLPQFSSSVGSLALAAREDTVIYVSFLPSSPGSIAAELTITSNDPDQPYKTVDLRGVGLIPPHIGVAPLSLVDTLPTGAKSTKLLTIANTGGSNLRFEVKVEGVETILDLAAEVLRAISMSETMVIDGNSRPAFTRAETNEFRSNLDKFYREVAAIDAARSLPQVAVVGGSPSQMIYYLMMDSTLATQYLLYPVDDYVSYESIKDYDGLIISEWDYDISPGEAASISAFCQSGKPVIMGLLQNSWKCHSEEHEVRRRIFNSLHGTKSRFFAALRMTMLKVGFVLSQQSHHGDGRSGRRAAGYEESVVPRFWDLRNS